MNLIQAWSTPPAEPVMPVSGELHLWLIDLDIPPENFERFLSADELERAGRLVTAAGSRRFVTARGCLRSILADYLETDAGSIGFRYGTAGKPEIAAPDSLLRFNLTHSGQLALLALTRQCEIGVDMEPLKPLPNLMAIAGKIFGAEVHQTLADLDVALRTVRFLQLWTAHEAQAKCCGNSVFSHPDSMIPVVNFEPDAGWIGAVAIPQGVPEVSKWRTYRLSPADF